MTDIILHKHQRWENYLYHRCKDYKHIYMYLHSRNPPRLNSGDLFSTVKFASENVICEFVLIDMPKTIAYYRLSIPSFTVYIQGQQSRASIPTLHRLIYTIGTRTRPAVYYGRYTHTGACILPCHPKIHPACGYTSAWIQE